MEGEYLGASGQLPAVGGDHHQVLLLDPPGVESVLDKFIVLEGGKFGEHVCCRSLRFDLKVKLGTSIYLPKC